MHMYLQKTAKPNFIAFFASSETAASTNCEIFSFACYGNKPGNHFVHTYNLIREFNVTCCSKVNQQNFSGTGYLKFE